MKASAFVGMSADGFIARVNGDLARKHCSTDARHSSLSREA